MARKTTGDIVDVISNLENSNKIRELVAKALSEDLSPSDIIENGLRVGLERVGEKYEAGEYFLSELLYAGSMMDDALSILKPKMREPPETRGKIVLGTARGDMHDIGKNIFKMLAGSAGFEVIDLDVDVEAEKFIEKIRESGAEILGISVLLTTVLPEIKNVIDKLNESGIRKNVKVIVGGNAATKEFGEEVGADAVALDAVEGVNICKGWMT